ncbi:MAG: hypothetical protein RLZZ505_920 [Verrucomicrobiota bacterium]
MRTVFLIPPAVFAASSFACLAEEKPFSKGLDRIAGLGLPEMKGAMWMKIPGDSEAHFTSSYQFQEMAANLSGNAWKLSTEPPTYLEFGSAITLGSDQPGAKASDAEADSKPGLLGKMLQSYQDKNPEADKKPKAPEPLVSQAAKDTAKLVKALGKASVVENVNDSIEYGSANLHGRLMLFAAQLQAAGETESANALAAALFKAAENDSALIDGAISHLADTEYTAAATAFFETTDWQAYHTAIKALLEKFPRGWADAPAVALLASNLEKRSATPPPFSLPGIAIKPEALALLDKLLVKQTIKTSDEALAKAQGMDLSKYPARQRAEMIHWLRANAGEGVSFSDPTLWLLPSEGKKDEQPASPIESLKAMRMDGFIALAAAVTDETFVPIRKQNEGGSYYSSSESPATLIRRRYANLVRPVSRGEIASALISSALPAPDGDSFRMDSEPDPADLAARAIEFWKTNKDKSGVELATLYIAEGNDTQRSFASNHLATSKDPAAHAAFEKTVLESNDPLSLIQAVEGYLGTRKAAAKPFATAYIQLIRDNPPSEEDLQRGMFGYQIREAGGIENYLKRLSLKVGDVSLDKMIAQALRAKPTKDESGAEKSPLAALAPAIQGMPLHECLTAFGKAQSTATAAQWMEIHQLLLGRIYYETRRGGEEDGEENKGLPEEVLKIWKPLIVRTDELPAEGDFPKFAGAYGAKTTGDGSALLIELATSPQLAYTLNYFAQAADSPGAVMAFARKRAEAWSSGAEPEPWPSSESVSEERVAEISEKIAALKADEIIPYAMSLPVSERLSLMEIVNEYGEEESLPEGLRELRNTLVSLKPVFDQDHDADTAAKLGLAAGDKITPELLTKISDALLLDAANSSTTAVMLFPAPLNLGTSLYVTSAKDLDPRKLQQSGVQYVAGLFGQNDNPEAMSAIAIDNAADIRILKDGKTVRLETEASALTDLTAALESKSPTLPYIRIIVLTRADAEKITNQDQ